MEREESDLINKVKIILSGFDNLSSAWKHISKNILLPKDPIDLHKKIQTLVFDYFSDHRINSYSAPVWFPTKKDIDNSNIHNFIKHNNLDSNFLKDYSAFHKWSVKKYKEFWDTSIKYLNINFNLNYTEIIFSTDTINSYQNIEKPNWLCNAKFNIVNSCFNADQNKTAIIWKDKNLNINKISYKELNIYSNQIANSIIKLGLKKSDKIALYMPMHYDAIAIYLGIIKAGCVVVAIAESFAENEIKIRLDITDTKLVFTQDNMIWSNKKIILAQKIKNIFNHKIINIDHKWSEFLSDLDSFTSVICNPHDHINILFSSGTTGEPKAIPWDHTSAIKAAVDSFFHIDLHKDDIIAWPTSLGWMMGPWLIFAGFINQSTIVLYNDLPTSLDFCKFIEITKTTILGLVPSIVKCLKMNNILDKVNWNNIRLFASSGEASNYDDMFYLSAKAGYKPIIEYCGGTEISGAYLSSTVVQENIPSAFSTPALGIDLVLLDNGSEVALIPPSIGLSRELINNDHHKIYYADMPKGYRRHGDAMSRLKNGYYRAQGRIDDTMNLSGIKVSSAEIERALIGIDNILETAAIAITNKDGGTSNLVIYAVLDKKNQSKNNNEIAQIKKKMQIFINTKLNPLFKIADLKIIDKLPRTNSNKIIRKQLVKLYSLY